MHAKDLDLDFSGNVLSAVKLIC